MNTLFTVALAAMLAGADPGFDTVFLQNGGRLRGTVVEEDPGRGVTIQIPGGQVRTVPPAEVFRIEYRDGTLGTLGVQPPPKAPAPPPAPPAPPAAAAPAAPPAAAAPPAPDGEGGYQPRADDGGEPAPRPLPPPPPGWTGRPGEPVRPLNPGALRPPPLQARRPALFTFAGGLGFMVPSGDVEAGIPMSDLTETLFLINLEGGVRLLPELQLGLYLDLGVGTPGSPARVACRNANFTSCDATAVKGGVQARWSFTPFARGTPWVMVGVGGSMIDVSPTDGSGFDLTYRGHEWRLGAGYDFRGVGEVGLGLFITGAWGTFTHVTEFSGEGFSLDERQHTWVQAGVRAILFP